MTNLTFPNDFWWGTATSGPQTEGRFNKKTKNVFDHWYDIDPGTFYDNVGPNTASNFYNSYKEDIRLYKEVGMNSVRLSIQWSRLYKNVLTGEIDDEGVAFYHKVIDEFHAQGIEPLINLHHFDLPVDLYHTYGGWESKKVVDLFTAFAEECFREYSSKVSFWFVFNEPMVIVDGQYLWKFHYPMISDGKKAVQVAYNLSLATAQVIKAFQPFKTSSSKIGTILNLTPAYAADESEENQKAARIANLWCNELFLSPAVNGHFPDELVSLLERDGVLWDSTEEELSIIAENTIDILGVNYYHPFRVQEPEVIPSSASDWLPTNYFDSYKMPGRVMNVDKGWEIYPKALYDIAKNIQENYSNIEWFVSENGMGVSREDRYQLPDGMINDFYRIDFIRDHLKWLHKGISEGSNCRGYHLWTAIDNWSWKNAYRNRYGLISNDIATQTKTVKKSGEWFRELSETNTLSDQ